MQNTLPMMTDFEAGLDDAAMCYLKNKKRGGESGSKGTIYELIFLACKAAKLIHELEAVPPADWPRLHWQLDGFVDDACVEYGVKTEFFQMKNSQSVSWTSGDHPICEDFKLQYAISQSFGTPQPRTNLVVPDITLHASLIEKIPNEIRSHTDVYCFPYLDGMLNRIVQEVGEVREHLKKISRSADPTIDNLEGILGMLYIACMKSKGGKSLLDIYNDALRCQPGQLRLLDVVDMPVLDKFKEALARIHNLTYDFDRGFFNWSALGMSGAFGASCVSEEFAEFQRKVVQKQPNTFDEFEEILS